MLARIFPAQCDIAQLSGNIDSRSCLRGSKKLRESREGTSQRHPKSARESASALRADRTTVAESSSNDIKLYRARHTMRHAVAPILESSNLADSSTKTWMVSVF